MCRHLDLRFEANLGGDYWTNISGFDVLLDQGDFGRCTGCLGISRCDLMCIRLRGLLAVCLFSMIIFSVTKRMKRDKVFGQLLAVSKALLLTR